MFHRHGARVEEDEGDDEPEPVGRLADPPYEEPKVLLLLPRLLVSLGLVSCGNRNRNEIRFLNDLETSNEISTEGVYRMAFGSWNGD